MPSGFSGRTESEVNTGYIFSWAVLEAATLVGHRAGVRATCGLGRLPGSTAVAALSESGANAKGAGGLRELGFFLA